jgi:hypothetical protein
VFMSICVHVDMCSCRYAFMSICVHVDMRSCRYAKPGTRSSPDTQGAGRLRNRLFRRLIRPAFDFLPLLPVLGRMPHGSGLSSRT